MSDVLTTRAVRAAHRHPWPGRGEGRPACAGHDPETWFPRTVADYAQAQAICAGCALVDSCRAVAAARGESGVWGGVLFDQGRALSALPKRGRPPKKKPAAA